MSRRKMFSHASGNPTRREFIQAGGAGLVGASLAGAERPLLAEAPANPRIRPNFLFIISDQLGLDALSAHGCMDARTPNMDRLVRRGVTFLESHSTNPVCSPARSSLLTGRMPVETGVISNSRPIHPSVPNLGHWFRQSGYRTAYCGKWHLPGAVRPEDGFEILPAGGGGQGFIGDTAVSRACEAWLRESRAPGPFALVCSLLNPHDICYWAIKGKEMVPAQMPFPQLNGVLPELPPNHKSRPKAPARLDAISYKGFSDEQWQYYIYAYYRMVEMVDAEIGRVLDALEATGLAEDTIVIFTSDHGEGRGRHLHVQKWYPYEEGVKVPLVVSCPGRILAGHEDRNHLVSGLDVMSTMCDYAEIQPPPDVRGRSLRPLLEGKTVSWREFVCTEHHVIGRMVRTEQYKYVKYRNDPVEQLFDMKADPWEKKNLYEQPKYASVVADHRKLLEEWESHLKPVPPTPDASRRRRTRGKKG